MFSEFLEKLKSEEPPIILEFVFSLFIFTLRLNIGLLFKDGKNLIVFEREVRKVGFIILVCIILL